MTGQGERASRSSRQQDSPRPTASSRLVETRATSSSALAGDDDISDSSFKSNARLAPASEAATLLPVRFPLARVAAKGTYGSSIEARRLEAGRARPARARTRRTVLWCTPRWRAIVFLRQPSTSDRRRISAAKRREITCPTSRGPPRPSAAQEIVADDPLARLATDPAP